jgi:hypothetical protein
MHPRLVFVDLPKDRRPEVYRFRPPRGEAKGGGGTFHLLGKSKLCSRKNAHRRCGILRRGKPSSTSVKVDCPKLVTDLGRPRFDVVETEVTHGRGTPLMSRSPRPFLLAEPAQNSNRARHCEPLRGGDKPADLPVQQPTKFSVSVVCSGTIGRSTLWVNMAAAERKARSGRSVRCSSRTAPHAGTYMPASPREREHGLIVLTRRACSHDTDRRRSLFYFALGDRRLERLRRSARRSCVIRLALRRNPTHPKPLSEPRINRREGNQ